MPVDNNGDHDIDAKPITCPWCGKRLIVPGIVRERYVCGHCKSRYKLEWTQENNMVRTFKTMKV